MNRNFKRFTVVLLLALSFSLVRPGVSRAQIPAERLANFCSNQTERLTNVSQAFAERLEAYERAVDNQSAEHTNRRQELSDQLHNERAEADAKRSQAYELMRGRQETDEAKAQVDALAREIDLAVQLRRTAYDEARAHYHRQVDDLVTARDRDVQSAAQTFQATAENLLQSAGSQCQTGQAGLVRIYQDTVGGLRAARLTYVDALRGRSEFRTGVQDAADVRDAAFEVARAQFEQTIQSLREKYSGLRS